MTLAKKRIGTGEYWYLRITIDGRRYERSLGSTAAMSKAQAELAAARATARLLEGEPDRPASKGPSSPPPVPTFAEVLPLALHDIKAVKAWRNPLSERQWKQTMRDYALPAIGSLRIDQVSVDDVLAVLRPIWTSRPETANRLRSRIEAVISWATVKHLRSGPNPAVWRGNLALLLPTKSKVRAPRHHAAPTVDELRLAVAYCLAHPSPVSGLLLWIAATAARVSEARGLRVEEIVRDVWTIPPVRMKSVAAGVQRIPVSSLAKKALKMGASDGLVFRSPVRGGELSLDAARMKLRMILKREVTAHGIRSTFRDWCAREGVPDAVAEKCLAHVWGNETTVAYYRDDLLDRRREVMERWSTALLQNTERPGCVC